MLEVRSLVAGYGSGTVLDRLDLEVRAGEVVALLGRNGMGKSTLIRCLVGLLPVRAGSIAFAGESIRGWPSHRIARRGLGLVPEGRQVFPNLTVREHLVAFARDPRRRWSDEAIFELFPRLRERRSSLGQHLSGGEQQMLAIARALAIAPRMLILDEASEGLAPLIRAEIWRCLERLKTEGLTILVSDKPHAGLVAVVDRCLVLERGRIAWSGSPAGLAADPVRRQSLLGV
ncbi:MAG TPA: ABC transporter ATP-binding protein [Geminicoccaceae bacterium]